MHIACYYIVIVKLLIFNVYRCHGMGQLYTSDANEAYYIDFENKFSWFDGQIACLRMNMTLVEIKTSTKSLELHTLITNLQNHNNIYMGYLWIGGILSKIPDKKFVWLSTGEHLTYTNWHANNPDFYNDNEFCIEMVMEENLEWNDDSCTSTRGFVCEYKNEIEIQQELDNLKQKMYNHLQVQSNLQQSTTEVVEQKEQIKHELQKEKDLQHEHLEKLQQFEEQKAEMKKEIDNYVRKMNQSLETQEKLKANLQTEVKNNGDLYKDLQKQKQLEQQLQEKLALREDEVRRQQVCMQQIQLQ